MFLISVEVFICEAMISGGEESLKKKKKINQSTHGSTLEANHFKAGQAPPCFSPNCFLKSAL